MSTFLMVAYGADPGFLKACDQTLAIVLSACRLITPMFMSIALLYTVMGGIFSGRGPGLDWGPIVKATWIFFLLFFYQDLIDTLSTGVAAFTALFSTDQSAAEALSKLTTPASVATAAKTDSMSIGDVVTGASDMMASAINMVSSFSLSNLLTRLFTGGAVLVVRQIMLFLQQFILGFLYVCGPISLCLTVIPSFGQLAMKWFQNFLAVQLWGLSFALLDTMYGFYADSATSPNGIFAGLLNGPMQSVDDSKFMIISVVFIILYVMVPYLTSLYIGSSAAQGFMGSVVGMAAGAATAAAGLVSPGGGGLASAVGRAVSSSGGGGGGGSGGSSAGGGGSAEPAAGSASAGLPSMTMAEAMNPTYRQRPSGLWTA